LNKRLAPIPCKQNASDDGRRLFYT